jgi:ribosomal protein L7Ae-like RNA K-turn-binding protein
MNKKNQNQPTKPLAIPITNDNCERYKRKKLKIPVKIVENESIEIVASFWGPIQTIPIEKVDKDILLDRLSKEIIKKYNFTLSNCTNKKNRTKDVNNEPRRKKKRSLSGPTPNNSIQNETLLHNDSPQSYSIIHQRIIVGVNQVTRLLESPSLWTKETLEKPLLVFLTSDIRPPTMVMHIPCLCRRLGIPLILIPGSESSLELGKIFGVRRVSVVVFTSPPSNHSIVPLQDTNDNCTPSALMQSCHADIDSYIDFAKSKQP